jgi:FMN reductase
MRRGDIEARNASFVRRAVLRIVQPVHRTSEPALSFILSLLGSPSPRSRSGALLAQLEARLAAALDDEHASTRLALRELPAQALLQADGSDRAIAAAIGAVRDAQLVLVATPIYKAAYSGLLKAFLDLLPQDALRGKTVVPLATGGSAAHLLALDYALKPVLAALGARDIRDAVYACDAELPPEGAGHAPVLELQQRLDRLAADLLGPGPRLGWRDRLRALPRVRVEPAARCTA